MSAPTQSELEREARRLFRKLATGARLLRLACGAYALVARARKVEHAKARVEAAVVEAMRAKGWLEGTEAELALSDAGLGWYRRDAASADPFAAQHRELQRRVLTDERGVGRGEGRAVSVNLMESPLQWLAQRGLLDKLQCDAGERLRRDYTLAQLTPRLGVDLTAPLVSGRRAPKDTLISDTVLAAKQRFSRAMAAVGPGLSDLLFDVCCDLKGLEESERAKGWPRASAKVVLKIALDRLARHYGLLAAPTHAPIRAWTKKEE
jgi:hypothetical protein